MSPETIVSTRRTHVGLRRAMIGLNLILIITGVILIILGSKINQHWTSAGTGSDNLPQLWALGLLPILVGLLGLICVWSANNKWIGIWVVFSSAIAVSSFVFFSVTGCLDSDRYGVTVHIFGDCIQQVTTCKCAWADRSRWWVVEHSSCDTLKFVTILYVVLIVLFVLCLTTTVICATLGCVLTCCLKFCIPKEDIHLELRTSIYGANMRPQPSFSAFLKPNYLLVAESKHTSSLSERDDASNV